MKCYVTTYSSKKICVVNTHKLINILLDTKFIFKEKAEEIREYTSAFN
jgi:hypothetical protein